MGPHAVSHGNFVQDIRYIYTYGFVFVAMFHTVLDNHGSKYWPTLVYIGRYEQVSIPTATIFCKYHNEIVKNKIPVLLGQYFAS